MFFIISIPKEDQWDKTKKGIFGLFCAENALSLQNCLSHTRLRFLVLQF